LFAANGILAQQQSRNLNSNSDKGKFYAYWGWNRSSYSDSDIRFKGKTFDFTLKEVNAEDEQHPFSLNPHLNPLKLTIPQTNFKIGYFISDRYSLSFGIDHMKYVLTQHQRTTISGYISGTGTSYDGEYHNDELIIEKDFLEYEHTDGLNYWNLEINRHDLILQHHPVRLSLLSGVGGGPIIPRSDVKLFDKVENNVYHVAGYGVSVKAGMNLNLFRNFFLQAELKGGFINLPDVRITHLASEQAKQQFYFIQGNIVVGFIVQLHHPKEKKEG
jgi:hypothetical protein